MSVTVEIKNSKNLRKVRTIAGVNSDGKAVELALEEYVQTRQPKSKKTKNDGLPESFWDELFSQRPILPAGSTSQAVIDDRNEARY